MDNLLRALSCPCRNAACRVSAAMTLQAAARRIGVSARTPDNYLNRIKKKYGEAGRPARTRLELAQRLREDALEDEPPL